MSHQARPNLPTVNSFLISESSFHDVSLKFELGIIKDIHYTEAGISDIRNLKYISISFSIMNLISVLTIKVERVN